MSARHRGEREREASQVQYTQQFSAYGIALPRETGMSLSLGIKITTILHLFSLQHNIHLLTQIPFN